MAIVDTRNLGCRDRMVHNEHKERREDCQCFYGSSIYISSDSSYNFAHPPSSFARYVCPLNYNFYRSFTEFIPLLILDNIHVLIKKNKKQKMNSRIVQFMVQNLSSNFSIYMIQMYLQIILLKCFLLLASLDVLHCILSKFCDIRCS